MGELSLPLPMPPGRVAQLKTASGGRWIAHCPPTLWSFFWMASSDPDEKPGGKRLPAAASGPLADGQALRSRLGFSPDVAHASSGSELPPSPAGHFHTKSFWTSRIGRFLSKKGIFCFSLWGYILHKCVGIQRHA